MLVRLLLVTITLLAIAGCATQITTPDLHGIYSRAAREHQASRNPVIVIPGILGTRLEQTGTNMVVWGAFGGGAADPETPTGASLVALPMRENAALRDLTDDVEPAGVLEAARVTLLGLPINLAAYAHILATLGVGGYRDEALGQAGAIDYGDDHYTCFQFGYDWRRDNIENAQRLARFVVEKRAQVQRDIERRYGVKDAPVKFDIVAHSMGGLVARWFLEYGDADLPADGLPPITWNGAKYIDRVLIVGTPNAGSAKSLLNLTDGAQFGPIEYAPAILGTMPSIYQLMPRPRHGAVVDGIADAKPVTDWLNADAWECRGWGLAGASDKVLRWILPEVNDASERHRVAVEHMRKCLNRAERFFAALDAPTETPRGLEIHLFAGDAMQTPERLALDKSGKPHVVGYSPGDGTVTRSSALMDERLDGLWRPGLRSPIDWTSVRFLFTDHLGLTRDPAFSDNVLQLLLEAPRDAGG